MMEKLGQELQKIKIGRVVDVATRRGDFAANLAKGLGDFQEIIAIDIDEKALAKGREALEADNRIKFECRNAYETGYPEGSFDMVALGNSLHHFEDVAALFQEMKRLLAPGGTLLISEMTAAGQEGASLTHALIHRGESDVDRAKGVYHRHTYSSREILDMVEAAGFKVTKSFFDWDKEPKLVKGVEKRLAELEEKLAELKELPDYQELAESVARIKANEAAHGAAFAAALVVFAEK